MDDADRHRPATPLRRTLRSRKARVARSRAASPSIRKASRLHPALAADVVADDRAAVQVAATGRLHRDDELQVAPVRQRAARDAVRVRRRLAGDVDRQDGVTHRGEDGGLDHAGLACEGPPRSGGHGAMSDTSAATSPGSAAVTSCQPPGRCCRQAAMVGNQWQRPSGRGSQGQP